MLLQEKLVTIAELLFSVILLSSFCCLHLYDHKGTILLPKLGVNGIFIILIYFLYRKNVVSASIFFAQ
jgi:hypothetical protein